MTSRPSAARDTATDQTAGPLGFLELTLHVVRDRSHSAWMFLRDEELLAAVHARGVVAAYLPGEVVGVPDAVLLRLAVTPEGHVAVAREGGRPEPGGQVVEELVVELLEELRTVAFIPPEEVVGPPWLPAEELVEAAHSPAADSRVVYCFRSKDTVVARSFARDLGMPLTVYQQDGWVVVATPHQPAQLLAGPPNRFTGAYPFVTLDRRGDQRLFLYDQSPKDSALHVSARWHPPLRPAAPPGSSREAEELARWLADAGAWRRDAAAAGAAGAAGARLPEEPASTRPEGMTPAQETVILRWMEESGSGDGFLPEVTAAFGLPAVAAQLVEARPGDPDPDGGALVEPAGTLAVIGSAIAEQDTEPTGRLPWTVLSRALWRRPALGLVLGVLELLAAAVIGVAVVATGSAWWWWVAVAVLALAGVSHAGEAVVRRRLRRSR